MRGATQSSGGSEGSFTDGALSLLRSSVAAAGAKDGKKAPKVAGKAFQTAHDSSGWDRKARWQRAFNLARSKMDGMDESVEKWGSAGAEGGDRRSASAQPARRISVGPGGALAGAPGTIAELRTPVALKEHLKRGRGARQIGIQLVTLEAGGPELPVSDLDAAQLVAQFEQRRQMLGAPASPGKPMLSPADRAHRAWAISNANNGNANANVSSGDTSMSSSNGSGSTCSNGCGNSSSSSSTGSSAAAAGSGDSPACSSSATDAADPAALASAAAAALNAAAAAVRALAAPEVANSGGGAAAAVTGAGTCGTPMLQRRLSDNSSSMGRRSSFTGGGGGGGGDAAVPGLRRTLAATGTGAPDSIVARHQHGLQTVGSGSMNRAFVVPTVGAAPAGSAVPTVGVPTRGSFSRQNSGALVPSPTSSGQGEPAGGWAAPGGGSVDGGGAAGAGMVRQPPRPDSAGRRSTISQTWLPQPPAVAARTSTEWPLAAAGGSNDGAAAGAPGASAGAPSPFASSEALASMAGTASLAALAPRQPGLTLPVLQVPPLAAERSCSPPRLQGPPRSGLPSASATAAGGGGATADLVSNVRRVFSPAADGGAAVSPSLGMSSTSPSGVVMIPMPPATSYEYTSGSPLGPRRPRPRCSGNGDGAAAPSTSVSGAVSPAAATNSQALPLLNHAAWASVDGAPGGGGGDGGIASGSALLSPAAAGAHSRLMHVSPASPSLHSPTLPNGVHQGYRRVATSSPGIATQYVPSGGGSGSGGGAASAATPQSSLLPSSPPVLRPHAPMQPPAANAPPSPQSTLAAHRRASMPAAHLYSSGGGGGGGGAGAGGGSGLSRAAVGAAALQPPQSPPQQPQSPQLSPAVSAAPVRHTAFKAPPRGRLTDDGAVSPPRMAAGTGGGAGSTAGHVNSGTGVRAVSVKAFKSAAAAGAGSSRTTPVSDAVLAGLRLVATEVADELNQEAEAAATIRQALAQRSRMRASDSGKPRYVSLPGDPWRKWG